MSIYLINELLGGQVVATEDFENTKHHAELGDAEAQYHLALMYDTGNGTARQPKEAERWYKLAVNSGNISAKYYLGLMYLTQNSGIRRDEKEAHRLFIEAAEGGHIEARKKISN